MTYNTSCMKDIFHLTNDPFWIHTEGGENLRFVQKYNFETRCQGPINSIQHTQLIYLAMFLKPYSYLSLIKQMSFCISEIKKKCYLNILMFKPLFEIFFVRLCFKSYTFCFHLKKNSVLFSFWSGICIAWITAPLFYAIDKLNLAF